MTMHEDPDLQVLERDLWRLTEPQEDDERLRQALRAQLAAGVRPRQRRRLSVRVVLGGAAVTAAAAAIAFFTVVGTTGSGGPSIADAAIIHHALAAVSPPSNEILHVKVVGVQNGVTVTGETWQQTSPPFASRGMKGQVGHLGEFGDNGTTTFEYDPATNTIYEQPDSSPPTFADPVSHVRQELASGEAQVAGVVTIGGTVLRKIDLPHGEVGYFRASDYRPVYLDDPQRDGSIVRLRVVAYEYLPMTPANQALLSVTAEHPRAQIAQGTSPGYHK
jgi:hypothetical protein